MKPISNKILIVLWGVFLIVSCGKHADLSDQYFKQGIVFGFETDENLNKIKGVPHALQCFVYQLSDRTAFVKSSNTMHGLRGLMEGEFSDSSVLNITPITLRPNQNTTKYIDKVEGTASVALVAYYSGRITRDDVMKIYSIPMDETGIIDTEKVPKKLYVDFVMGSSRIVSSQEKFEGLKSIFTE